LVPHNEIADADSVLAHELRWHSNMKTMTSSSDYRMLCHTKLFTTFTWLWPVKTFAIQTKDACEAILTASHQCHNVVELVKA
jgi:hypothetical protein